VFVCVDKSNDYSIRKIKKIKYVFTGPEFLESFFEFTRPDKIIVVLSRICQFHGETEMIQNII
jgi:hypothetical protein